MVFVKSEQGTTIQNFEQTQTKQYEIIISGTAKQLDKVKHVVQEQMTQEYVMQKQIPYHYLKQLE